MRCFGTYTIYVLKEIHDALLSLRRLPGFQRLTPRRPLYQGNDTTWRLLTAAGEDS